MSNDYGWAEQAAYLAMISTTVSACVIPTAWPIVGTMYGYQCKPGDLVQAAERWQELAGVFGDCASDLDRLLGELGPDIWSGADRDEFAARVADYRVQFTAAREVAVVMMTALIVIALLLFALILLMDVVAGVMAFFAAAILACLAGVVSAPVAAELFVEADAIALECEELLMSSGTAINATSDLLALALTAEMARDIVTELFHGDGHVGRDFAQGLLTGSDTVIWGLLASYEQQYTGMAAGTGFAPVVAVAVADSSPYESVSVPTGTTILRSLLDPERTPPQ